jgi:hypothetical protein
MAASARHGICWRCSPAESAVPVGPEWPARRSREATLIEPEAPAALSRAVPAESVADRCESGRVQGVTAPGAKPAYSSLAETSLAATTALAALAAAAAAAVAAAETRRSPCADALAVGLPGASASASGSLIVTSVPAPGSLVISMLP